MKVIIQIVFLIGLSGILFLVTSIRQPNKVNLNFSHVDLLLWQKGHELTWNDFKGRVDPKSDYLAITSSEISINSTVLDETIKLNISAFFKRHKSWTKMKNAHKNLLKHEQLHFDIAELVARKMRKKMSNLTYDNIKILEGHIHTIYYDHINRVWDNYDVYDLETNHGINRENQLKWERKIENELRSLDKYSEQIVIIHKVKS